MELLFSFVLEGVEKASEADFSKFVPGFIEY